MYHWAALGSSGQLQGVKEQRGVPVVRQDWICFRCLNNHFSGKPTVDTRWVRFAYFTQSVPNRAEMGHSGASQRLASLVFKEHREKTRLPYIPPRCAPVRMGAQRAPLASQKCGKNSDFA